MSVSTRLGQAGLISLLSIGSLGIAGRANADAYALRTTILLELEFPDSAMADIRAGLRRSRQDAILHLLRAGAFLELDRTFRAVMSATDALQIDPFLAAAYRIRGLAYERRGQHAFAQRDRAWARRLSEKSTPSGRPIDYASTTTISTTEHRIHRLLNIA